MGLFEQFPFTNFHEMNLDWIIKEIKENENKINEVNKEKNSPVFETVDNMLKSNTDFRSCICLKYSDKNNEIHKSYWEKTAEDYNGISILKGNGTNWKIYGEVDILSISDQILDYSEIINHLIEKEYRIFIPAGIFYFSVSINKRFRIRGSGLDTIIYPINDIIFNLRSNGTALNGSYMCDMYAKSGGNNKTFFYCESINNNDNDMMDRCVFDNLKIENFAYAFNIKSRVIYNIFNRVNIDGSLGYGIVVNNAGTNMAFNANTFYNCDFQNCVNSAIYIRTSTTEYKCIGNNFIACRIQGNLHNLGGMESNSIYAVDIYGYGDIFTFNNCYFENNNTKDTSKYIFSIGGTTYITIANSCFTLEGNIITNNTNCKCDIISCYKTTDITGNVTFGPGTTTVAYGNIQ